MIRNLEIKDAPYMFEWVKDIELTRDLQKDFGSMTESNVLDFIEKYCNQTEQNESLHYAIVEANDEYMGTVSLKNINRRDKNAEYSIIVRRKAQGKGYAQTATKEILEKAFYELKLEKIYLYVSTNNIVANKFYRKFGFKEEGVFRKHIMVKGKLEDIRWYSVLKDEEPWRE